MCTLRNICLERFNTENLYDTNICIHKKNKKSEVSHLNAPRQENKLHDKTSISRIRLKALNLTKEQPKV